MLKSSEFSLSNLSSSSGDEGAATGVAVDCPDGVKVDWCERLYFGDS